MKKVLILSPYPEKLIETIKYYGDLVFLHNEPINLEFLIKLEIDYIICFGYKYIICKDVINYLPNRIFNLHISYLPFNKGYYPNLWSHIEKTPSGVSIHQIDEGIDTGNIVSKTYVNFENEKNISKAYRKLLRLSSEVLADATLEIIDSGNIKTISNQNGNYYSKIPIRKYFKAKKYFKHNGEK